MNFWNIMIVNVFSAIIWGHIGNVQPLTYLLDDKGVICLINLHRVKKERFIRKNDNQIYHVLVQF